MSQSMNKLRISLFPSASLSLSSHHPSVRVHSRTPHRRNATHHQPREAVNLEKESGVEQMNSRRRKRISRLLNLAEANVSFVEEGNRKAGHSCPTFESASTPKREIIYLCERAKGTDGLSLGTTKWRILILTICVKFE